MMIILILIGVAFLGGWITLIHLVVRNEVRFEDKQKRYRDKRRD